MKILLLSFSRVASANRDTYVGHFYQGGILAADLRRYFSVTSDRCPSRTPNTDVAAESLGTWHVAPDATR